jgi:6-phosphogluconolactonase (cycloisomerase 2 family)
MPVLSTKAANSAQGYGLGLSANATAVPYSQYGWEINSSLNGVVSVFISADGTAAYSLNSNFAGTSYSINAYKRDTTTGFLTYVNSSFATTTTSSGGATLVIAPSGNFVFLTFSNNYTSSTETQNYVLTYTINTTTKGLASSSSSYSFSTGTGTAACFSTISPDGNFIYTGSALLNKIYVASINSSTGQLTLQSTTTTPTSTVPKSSVITSDGKFLYAVSSESTGTNGVLQFSRNTSTGALTPLSPAGLNTLPLGQPGSISPNGRFLYIGTPTGISIFIIDPFAGTLTLSLNQSGTAQITFTFKGDSSAILAAQNGNALTPANNLYQGTIDPSGGSITDVTFPYLTNLTNSVYTPYSLTASPDYNFYYMSLGFIYFPNTSPYYSMSEIVVCKIIDGYLTPINWPANLLPYSVGSSGQFNTTGASPSALVSRLAISPDNTFAYSNASTFAATGALFNRNTITGQLAYKGTSALGYVAGNNGAVISPDGNHIYSFFSENSAGNSKVYQYSRNTSTGALTALSPASLTLINGNQYSLNNPTFSLDGTTLYVAASNYTGQSPSILAFSRNTSTGLLTYINSYRIGIFTTSTANQYFDVFVAPSGNFVYGLDTSNPGQIVTFSRNTSTGALTQIAATGSLGVVIYAGCMSANGKNIYVLHTNSSGGNLQIDTFSVNTSTGAITNVGTMTTTVPNSTVQSAMSLVCAPNGKSIYFCVGTNYVYQVLRNANTGTLSTSTNSVRLLQYSYQMTQKGLTNGLKFSPDGKSLYAFSGPYLVQLVING